MIKEKDILIRIDSELKEKLKQKAKSLGLSLSSYIRLTLIKELKDE
jgi:antitoxin component of RelBE/YafQ-DinJ toxin-antitoxin module